MKIDVTIDNVRIVGKFGDFTVERWDYPVNPKTKEKSTEMKCVDKSYYGRLDQCLTQVLYYNNKTATTVNELKAILNEHTELLKNYQAGKV